MHPRDIPVVGDIIDAVLVYVWTLWQIARNPFAFSRRIDFSSLEHRRHAFKFLGAAIPFGYLILTPALRKHEFAVDQLFFGVLALLRFVAIVVLYHVAFGLFGYRRPVWTSLVLGAYINGLYFPFFMATMLPGFLAIGPQYYFGSRAELSATQAAALETPSVVLAFLAFVAGFAFFFALTSRWWADAYGAGVWLAAVLLAVTLGISGLGYMELGPLILRFLS